MSSEGNMRAEMTRIGKLDKWSSAFFWIALIGSAVTLLISIMIHESGDISPLISLLIGIPSLISFLLSMWIKSKQEKLSRVS